MMAPDREEYPPFFYASPFSTFLHQGTRSRMNTASSSTARYPVAPSFAATWKETSDNSSITGVSGSRAPHLCAAVATSPVDSFSLTFSLLRSSLPLSCSSSAVASAVSSPSSSSMTSSASAAANANTKTSRCGAAPSQSTSAAVSGGAIAAVASPSSASVAPFAISPAAPAAPLRSPDETSPVSVTSARFFARLPPSTNEARCGFSAALQTLPAATNSLLRCSSMESDAAAPIATGGQATALKERISSNGGASAAKTAVTEAVTEPLQSEEDVGEQQQQQQNSNLYEVLGVSPRASADEIRRVYYALCKVYHPDKCPSAPSGVCAAKLHALQQAYGVLGDETRRLVYDIRLGLYSGAEKRKRVAQLYRLQRERTRRDIENMREEYKCKLQQERRVNGLLIRKAWYGNLGLRRSLRAQNYVGPVTKTCIEGPFLDVTVALQCQIDSSRFVFSGGADCSLDQLKGFHNPAVCTSNEDSVCLYVLYDFQGMSHEATASHQSPLAMPLKRHRISLALGPLGPYAPSNVTSLRWGRQGIPYPLQHTERKVPTRDSHCVTKGCLQFANNENADGAVLSKPLHPSEALMGEPSSRVLPIYVWSLVLAGCGFWMYHYVYREIPTGEWIRVLIASLLRMVGLCGAQLRSFDFSRSSVGRSIP